MYTSWRRPSVETTPSAIDEDEASMIDMVMSTRGVSPPSDDEKTKSGSDPAVVEPPLRSYGAADPLPDFEAKLKAQFAEALKPAATYRKQKVTADKLEDNLSPNDAHSKSTERKTEHAASDNEGWDLIYDRLKEHDIAMIAGDSGEMDTVLIFAGLFSSVLASVVLQVYSQLQPDNTQISAQALIDISRQMRDISRGVETDVTAAAVHHFAPSGPTVIINCLWFLSLILSLAASLFAIFVKQWLREYISWVAVRPVRDAIHLREYRHEAFKRWHIAGMVAGLPILLQAALVLFFAGLLLLLWTVNRAVAITATASAGLVLLLTIIGTILPLFRKSFPYRTPLSWAMLRAIFNVRASLEIPVAWIIARSACTYYAFRKRLWPLPQPIPNPEAPPLPNDSLTPIIHRFNGKPAVLSHTSWNARDMALSRVSLGPDPVHMIAFMCRSLLWVSAHDRFSARCLNRCIADFFGPSRDAFETPPESVEDRSITCWPENPFKRICAYWVAISHLLGFPTDKTPLPLLDAVQAVCREGISGVRLRANETQAANFERFKSRVAALSPHTRETIFHLLASAIHEALDRGTLIEHHDGAAPFDEKTLDLVYLASMYLMRRLCHKWSGLHLRYIRLALRVIEQGNTILRWRYSTDNLFGGTAPLRWLAEMTDHVDLLDCSASEWVELASHAIANGKNKYLIVNNYSRRLFWETVNLALTWEPTRGEPDALGECEEMREMLLQVISDGIKMELSKDKLQKGEEWRPLRLWPRVLAFCGRHKDLVPDELRLELCRGAKLCLIKLNTKDALFKHIVTPGERVNAGYRIPFTLLERCGALHADYAPSSQESLIGGKPVIPDWALYYM